MNFYDQTGPMAIVSRLRRLTETLTDQADRMYACYGTELKAKWFPVFFVLGREDQMTVTSIAQRIGHSHPSVSKIVREMATAGLITEQRDEADARRTLLSLSPKGRNVALTIGDQYADATAAVNTITQQTANNMWEAIGEWETLLEEQSMVERILAERRKREGAHVRIVDYTPEYRTAFKALNERWIKLYFTMEEADYKALDHPESSIISKGGHILVALYKDEPVGVCALVASEEPDFDFEMSKMAVSPAAQGKHIGYLLGNAIIAKAKQLGAKRLYLDSSTTLKPAINLYRKLGFQRIPVGTSAYQRCNIRMAMDLSPTAQP